MPFISAGHVWLALIVLVIVLVIWGPNKLGDIGGALGRGLREFKKASSETKEQFSSALNEPDKSVPAPSPAAEETKISG